MNPQWESLRYREGLLYDWWHLPNWMYLSICTSPRLRLHGPASGLWKDTLLSSNEERWRTRLTVHHPVTTYFTTRRIWGTLEAGPLGKQCLLKPIASFPASASSFIWRQAFRSTTSEVFILIHSNKASSVFSSTNNKRDWLISVHHVGIRQGVVMETMVPFLDLFAADVILNLKDPIVSTKNS